MSNSIIKIKKMESINENIEIETEQKNNFIDFVKQKSLFCFHNLKKIDYQQNAAFIFSLNLCLLSLFYFYPILVFMLLHWAGYNLGMCLSLLLQKIYGESPSTTPFIFQYLFPLFYTVFFTEKYYLYFNLFFAFFFAIRYRFYGNSENPDLLYEFDVLHNFITNKTLLLKNYQGKCIFLSFLKSNFFKKIQ